MNGTLLATRDGLIARLVRNEEEIAVAQRLRYEVFHHEFGAHLTTSPQFPAHDLDPYDQFCDHLLIVAEKGDTAGAYALEDGHLIGTCRLLRQARAQNNGGFYSATEFNLDELLRVHRELNFAEVGRACVHADYRSRLIVDLMWKGIGAFVGLYEIDVLIGCASFLGTHLGEHAQALSYLYHFHAAPKAWPVTAIREKRQIMNLAAPEHVDQKYAIKAIPTLLKGYLRLGAYVCSEAVIDPEFCTIDVLTIVPIANVSERYKARFGKPVISSTKVVDLDNLSN